MTTLTALLEGVARRAPGAPAILDGGAAWSFADLAAESRRLARGLADLGIGQGDRVGLWLPNGAACVALLFACARIGAVAVFVNTRYRSAEVGDVVGRTGCKALALWPGFRGIPFLDILGSVEPGALAGLEALVLYGEEDEAGTGALSGLAGGARAVAYADLHGRPGLDHDAATPDAGAVVFTTSGTTAAPRFVLHSQRGIADHAREVAAAFGYDAPGSVTLQALPLSGTFGLAQAMGTLAAGRPMVLMAAFDGAEAGALMRTHRVTQLNGTDAMFAGIIEAAGGERPFPDLCYGGYAAFTPALGDIVARAEARGVVLTGLWGMSECQALFARQPHETETAMRARAGGRLTSPGAAVRARDRETGQILPHGEPGEIEVRGPSLMLGYLDDEAATSQALTGDGFVRTGDLGHTEEDGGFVFLARMGDVLRLGGYLVAPAEIEAHLAAHPAVERAVVVGVETGKGARAFAFVVPGPGVAFDEAALMAHCAAGLAKFKHPLAIRAVEDFPVTQSPNGVKIRRDLLRKMAGEATG